MKRPLRFWLKAGGPVAAMLGFCWLLEGVAAVGPCVGLSLVLCLGLVGAPVFAWWVWRRVRNILRREQEEISRSQEV